jgi:hypothetical protein
VKRLTDEHATLAGVEIKNCGNAVKNVAWWVEHATLAGTPSLLPPLTTHLTLPSRWVVRGRRGEECRPCYNFCGTHRLSLPKWKLLLF